eukprot:m.117018 g.117018  ORF g.117018 m.117018 type:complete len:313 (+) comp17183_c0_seq24:98-1036(+)
MTIFSFVAAREQTGLGYLHHRNRLDVLLRIIFYSCFFYPWRFGNDFGATKYGSVVRFPCYLICMDSPDDLANDPAATNGAVAAGGEPDIVSWGLDPTFWAYRKCFIGYVLTRLKPSVAVAKGFLGEYNQPVVRVEVGGVIVSVDPRSDKISYVVDDGTGCIPCIHWRQKNEKNEVVDTSDVSVQPLGTYVHMQGYLGLFRGNIQLTVKHVVAVADPNAECCHCTVRCVWGACSRCALLASSWHWPARYAMCRLVTPSPCRHYLPCAHRVADDGAHGYGVPTPAALTSVARMPQARSAPTGRMHDNTPDSPAL